MAGRVILHEAVRKRDAEEDEEDVWGPSTAEL